MKIKLNYIINLIITILLCVTLIYVANLGYDLQEKELDYRYNNPSIQYTYDCNQEFIDSYYNCNGSTLQNITGKYCNNKLVCQNSYILWENKQ